MLTEKGEYLEVVAEDVEEAKGCVLSTGGVRRLGHGDSRLREYIMRKEFRRTQHYHRDFRYGLKSRQGIVCSLGERRERERASGMG